MVTKINAHMTNAEIAELFREIAAVYQLQGIEGFRVQAYVNVANSIEQLPTPLREIWEGNDGALEEVPGIGKKFHKYLDELFRTGHIKRLERILRSEPAGMYPLLDVPGIGPKTAYKLAHALRLGKAETAVEKVRAAAAARTIQKIEGFSAVTEEKISHAIDQHYKHVEKRMLLPEAEQVADDVMEYLRKSKLCEKTEALGSLRRRAPTIGDIDIAVATPDPDALMAYLEKFPHLQKVISVGPKMMIFLHASGWQIDVKTQFPAQWGSMLQHYTGSKLHNIHLRTLALSKKLSLSENGVKSKSGTKFYTDEPSFYRALGLEYIPPELREDAGEIEAAKVGRLPKLIEEKHIRGDFHIHTSLDFPSSHDASVSSIAEILVQAEKLHYDYIGLSDHNPKQLGLTKAERLAAVKKRNAEIEKQVAAHFKKTSHKIHVFKGLEVDILPDCNLALEDEALELLDYAIASIHSQFELSSREMTRRILKGLAHPKVRIFGHPTARSLEKRPEIEADWATIFKFCAEHRKTIEINASPRRLDLPAQLIREALQFDLNFVIDTDAHAAEHLLFMKYGVWNARRGWLTEERVMNSWSLEKVKHELFMGYIS